MRLARLDIGGDEVVARIEGEQARVLARGGQSELLRIAMGGDIDAGRGEVIALAEARVLAPIATPPSIRDFFAFEAHVRDSNAKGEVNPAWYTRPWFYFTNPAGVLGPDDTVRAPKGCRCLDYELELAIVVGQACSDLDPDDPATLDVIAGFTIFNDWSARDVQMPEMAFGLGPQKGKDFNSSLGPVLTTADELTDLRTGRPALAMEARVNGQRWSQGNASTIHFSWGDILARASQDTRLVPGDVLASGTVGTGCILELRTTGDKAARPWLQPGDVVELEVEKIGVLRNTVVARPE